MIEPLFSPSWALRVQENQLFSTFFFFFTLQQAKEDVQEASMELSFDSLKIKEDLITLVVVMAFLSLILKDYLRL